ncbi:GDSL esterase/lipase 7-like [Durio zibethinus]|uniref:GDSL esterase/lipase 7-like n=1 Tax=Durio zibethinus TaxID=66656 RepID=A0A6P6A567_DURZI|nr:GDSL esterase/lipase 7-like [Durio zibethinus]
MKIVNCIFIFFLLLQYQFFSLGSADVVTVPPFIISKKSILKYLSLENINFDVPALYVFGDSYVDAGNNNYVHVPQIERNYTPYGIDFGGKPTGRYTNGRTVADFIAQIVGLPFPPPVLSLSKGDKRIPQTGINYACGFTGILEKFGKLFVRHPNLHNFSFILFEQVDLFESTTKGLQSQFQSKESFSRYLSKSLFFINSAAYDLDIEWDGLRYFYDENYYTQLLIKDLSKHLQRLYQLGARKIVVNNASPIGCQPHLISGGRNGPECDYLANNRALLFNKRLTNLLKDLQSTLSGSKFVLGDLYKIFQDVYASPTWYGFTDVRSSCCTEIDKGLTKPCLANVAPCKDRSSHVFFDPMHPSESMHFIWARRLLKDSSVSSPINLIQLIQS